MPNPNNKQIAELLADNLLTAHPQDQIDTVNATKYFEKMLNIPELKPLLLLTALGVRAQHELAEPHKSPLLIIIDCSASNVNNSMLEDKNLPLYYRRNSLYLAGNLSENAEENKQLIRNNFLYGITQFVIDELYKNNGHPFFEEDVNSKARWDAICKNRIEDKDKLLPKISQMLGLIDSESIRMLSPDIMGYYEEVLLPCCRFRLEKLYQSHGYEPYEEIKKEAEEKPNLAKLNRFLLQFAKPKSHSEKEVKTIKPSASF